MPILLQEKSGKKWKKTELISAILGAKFRFTELISATKSASLLNHKQTHQKHIHSELHGQEP